MVVKTKKYTKQEILDVWQEGQIIKGKNPKLWRKDDSGTVIKFTDYEKSTKFAWQID